MKLIFLGIIRMYWYFIPEAKRRNCLFRESCSKYVYRITTEKGFIKGWLALRERIKKCRPGYHILKVDDTYLLYLKDGTTVSEENISISLLANYKR